MGILLEEGIDQEDTSLMVDIDQGGTILEDTDLGVGMHLEGIDILAVDTLERLVGSLVKGSQVKRQDTLVKLRDNQATEGMAISSPGMAADLESQL